MKTTGSAIRSVVLSVRFAIATLILVLFWNAVAFAQSREDQYGSPTDPVDPVGPAGGAMGILPDTGGPLVLFVGAALILAGTAAALFRSRRAGRR